MPDVVSNRSNHVVKVKTEGDMQVDGNLFKFMVVFVVLSKR